MIFRAHILLFLITFTPMYPAYAQDTYDPKFYCDEQERFLSDEEFVRLALGYELEKQQAGYRHDTTPPEGYEIGSVDAFLENNPDGFNVERDPKAWRNQGRSWMARLEDWLDGEQVIISILLPSETIGESKLILFYLTDECGTINDDRFFSISNHYITE